MAKKKEIQGDERLENVDNALSKTELWIEGHQTLIYCIIGAVIVIAGIIWGIKAMNNKKNEEASNEIFTAQQLFEKGSYEAALTGDGNYLGFTEIYDSYGNTKSGKLAACYAGVCYMKLGQYEQAIDYLKKFDGNDDIVAPLALGAIADCYMELDDVKSAVTYYEKAAKESNNEFNTPRFYVKAGMAYEILGDLNSALNCYKTVKKEYPNYKLRLEIDKYIAKIEEQLQH